MTKCFEVIAGLHLTVPLVAEIVLLDNASGKVFDAAKDVAKLLQPLISLYRLCGAFTAAVVKILNQFFIQLLVILP